MPYIDPSRRIDANVLPRNAGELTFKFVQAINLYLNTQGESFQTYSDIIGALETTKLELYRRQVAKYEDKKLKENGDVF